MFTRRPPRARPLVLAALALVVGLVSGLSGGTPMVLAPAVLAVALLALLARIMTSRGLLIAATMMATGVGGALIGEAELHRAGRDCRGLWESGDSVRIDGIALSHLPEGIRGRVRFHPIPDRRLGCLWVGGFRVWTDGPVVPGARYTVRGSWQPAHRPGRGVRAPEVRGWIAADDVSQAQPARATRHPFLWLRGVLAGRLWNIYPSRWAPLAVALVLGGRETLSRETGQRIARAGLAHLLAISGLHVGMLAAALYGLARVARCSVPLARAVTVGLTFGYVALIGMPASAVRAALMIGLWMLARAAGRASAAFDVLGLAAVLLLLLRPWSVTEPGFQLSFAGAAAVAYVSNEARFIRWPAAFPRIARGACIGVMVSAAAVTLTAPITATFFGRVTPAALVGNLLAIPVLAMALPALFISGLLSAWPGLAAWPAAAASLLLAAIDGLASVLASAPWSAFDVAPPGLAPSIAYLALLALGAHAAHGAWQRRRFILGLGVAWSLTLAWPAVRARLDLGHLAVYVLDVGQGDAIALRTPNGHWLLVDAGPRIRGFDAGATRVVPFLRQQGARDLEAWIASHPDLDHVGGFPAVARAFPVRRVITVGHVTGQIGQLEVLKQVVADSLAWLRADAGDTLRVDGVVLAFLHPDLEDDADELAKPNAWSLVFSLEYGAFRMMFTGDVPGAIEDRLAHADSSAVRVQVLKVSHHGSASSTSRRFLRIVHPELALISVGRGNTYGHPSEHTLRRLALQGVTVRRTDRDGTVIVEARSDGTWRARTAAEGY
ncbi:MAG: DNA internalization-related competence protein ComEC/Rec2 [Gemmatimonadetes bacterium]|uniref:DNA internalization-related competence protein ComEC/Rec2 n=1 Tax=Candidatus Kutchimonas denitrificans TaxID=3056748 RepID=A0AAE4Z6M9_9BACT|nr:DNA internalization-related competence protein ComEC/Rec2 [Gemmatimonadota bacterium]NIR74573.1 DNA internalization-related competence protein ComEC/Rec2 [Candidatus Kutchimonas denitrificans]NIS02763.1 DNA internalization-related competence protein ComEC/Rec2 [Gemmatimonadota bacterium]NIT68924.1 DNA internalization-related competence protein ComEC/Rec2 [Gemmatimonadota bacterium]NIU52229.1 DNA internalization-related competence protein ComEC/Rec2 [Gemmatimonadota bacterium]